MEAMRAAADLTLLVVTVQNLIAHVLGDAVRPLPVEVRLEVYFRVGFRVPGMYQSPVAGAYHTYAGHTMGLGDAATESQGFGIRI